MRLSLMFVVQTTLLVIQYNCWCDLQRLKDRRSKHALWLMGVTMVAMLITIVFILRD